MAILTDSAILFAIANGEIGDKKDAKYHNQPNEPISSKNHLNK